MKKTFNGAKIDDNQPKQMFIITMQRNQMKHPYIWIKRKRTDL